MTTVILMLRRVDDVAKVRYLMYQCASCGMTDTVKLFDSEQAPAGINCWNCHAGQGREGAEMLAGKQGMFPAFKTRKGSSDGRQV